jgi:hypothetical protein
MAAAGDSASSALLFFANLLECAASHVESLPDAFWTP